MAFLSCVYPLKKAPILRPGPDREVDFDEFLEWWKVQVGSASGRSPPPPGQQGGDRAASPESPRAADGGGQATINILGAIGKNTEHFEIVPFRNL